MNAILAGQDYPVVFTIPKEDGSPTLKADIVDMFADLYSVNGTKYVSYSLNNPATNVRLITGNDLEGTFTLWIDSITTKAAIGDTVRMMVNVVSEVSSLQIPDGRCNTPYILDIPPIEAPTIEIKP